MKGDVFNELHCKKEKRDAAHVCMQKFKIRMQNQNPLFPYPMPLPAILSARKLSEKTDAPFPTSNFKKIRRNRYE